MRSATAVLSTTLVLAALCGLTRGAAAAASAPAPAEASLTLEDGRTAYPVRDVQVIVDPTRALTIEDIRGLEKRKAADWQPVPRLNFGYSKARHWLKVPVANLSSESSEWLLEFGYPLIQVLHVYQFNGKRQAAGWQTGRLAPFHSRPIAYRNFLFDLSIPTGSRTDLYVMVESAGTVLAPMAVYSQREFLSQSAKKTAAIGVYCGIILAMVLYNFFLFVSIRDRNYLYYIAYASTFCLLMTSLNGMTYQYLWPEWVQWNKISVPILAGVCYLFLALFTRSFLETKRLVPRLDWGLDVVLAGSVFLICGGAFFYGLFVNRFTSLLISAAPLIVLPISLRCMNLGSRVAAYYVIAFGCFFIGSGTHAARDLSWLPQNFATENGPYLGSAAEMILLSLGLAARIKFLKEEKLKSELQTVEAERQLAESKKKLESQIAVSALASQVAHDIRSPLAALDSVIKDVAQLPEEKRIIVRSAVSRIHDIANDLIGKNRELRSAADPGAAEAKTRELLSSHVAPLITEKRLQFRSKIGIAIEGRLDAGSYGLFAEIQPTEFKRVLSNLVDNAVEALGEKGAVKVNLASEDSRVIMKVRDNGKGIPPEILKRLGSKGETHGKAGGSGLGLYHAKRSVAAWGGSLDIDSEVGMGTVVTVRLPLARPPEWFVSRLELEPGGTVVVLDDDTSIHQVWQGRFDSLQVAGHGIDVVHFSTPREVRAWARGNAAKAEEFLYLTDYELLGHKETGLDLVEDLGLGARSILVTSRYEEKAILDQCLRLKTRMIPKGLAGFVPIDVKTASGPAQEGPDAVLVDDDELVNVTWKSAAQSRGLRLVTFRSPDDFLSAVEGLPKRTRIYLDSELGGGVRGEEIAKDLQAKGFSDLYLATGRPPEEFPKMPWIKRIVGKEPPWS